MGVFVVESLPHAVYHFADPDAFLSCDAPTCDVAWVAASGLVSWRLASPNPDHLLWTDRFVVGHTLDCLHEAQRSRGRRDICWSEPLAVGAWLDALRASLDCDPTTTPIGDMLPLGS